MKLAHICESTTSIDSIIAKVKKDCKTYLREADDCLMYRGFNSEKFFEPMTIIQHFPNRKPINTTTLAHNMLDDYSLEKFGWKIRSDTLFVSGDYYRARDYSYDSNNVYVVFPIDEFEFVWSPKVDDFYAGGEDMPDPQVHNINTYVPTDEYRKEVYEFFDGLNYQADDLSAAIKSKNEIMLNAKKYYVIRVCDLFFSVNNMPPFLLKINSSIAKELTMDFFNMVNK